MEYRNTKTGVVITVSSEISGGSWEPVKAPAPAVSIEKPEAPKKTTTRVRK